MWREQIAKAPFCKISFLCPNNVVEQGHEDCSIFKFIWTCLTSFEFVLNLLEHLQWKRSPLELNWFAIDPTQIFVVFGLFESLEADLSVFH